MSDVHLTPRQERDLVRASGSNPRRVAPGTVVISGDRFTWSERCRARCPHPDGICHAARVSLLPWESAAARPTERER